MEFGAAFPADGEAFEVVEQGEGLLDDVAELADALDVGRSLARDDRQDPALAQRVPVRVGVVALVAEQGVWSATRPAGAARDGRDPVDQGEGLSDVVDVRRGRDDLEWGAAAVAERSCYEL